MQVLKAKQVMWEQQDQEEIQVIRGLKELQVM
jgi:hypothetical protein